jgi:integrase
VLKRYGGQIARKAFNNMKSLITGTFVYAKVIRRINCIYTRELIGSYSPSPRQFKRPKMYLQVFADDEVEMIINRITSLYWDSERHLGLLFMLFTGVRVGELATLKMFDFLPGGKLHIQRTISKAKDESGKSHRIISDFPKTPTSDSIVYLSDDAMTVYQQVMKLRKEKEITSEFLFSEKGTYIADTIFDKTMRKLCTELDIPIRSCHKLRKTYCSELLDLGISEKIVQNQMRHADIATTKGHYYFSTKKEAAIKEALNRNNKLCVNI